MMITDSFKESIYRDYHAKVVAYIQSQVNNRDLAEDLASEVFLKVYEKLETYDESKAAINTWIFTIVRNRLIDYYRTRKITVEIPEEAEDDTDLPEERILREEMLETLAAALKQLDERKRDIVVLHYYSGKTLAQIAEEMEISYSYVKLLHKEALAELRPFFER